MKIRLMVVLILSLVSWTAEASDYAIKFGEVRNGMVVPTNILKLCLKQTGYAWGFEISLPTNSNSEISVVYNTPAAPAIFDKKSNSAGGTQFPFDIGLESGDYVMKSAFDDGDPVGAWSLDILVNKMFVAKINFTVVNPISCP